MYHADVAKGFAGECWTQDSPTAQRFKLHHVQGSQLPGLGRERIHFGGNSGYQAINLAYLWGAARIVLIGFDLGGTHWFGDHPKPLQMPSPYRKWLPAFDRLAADLADEGVQVINSTTTTALTCFERMPIEAI